MEMITLPGGGKLNVAEYVTPGHHTGVHIGNYHFPSQTLRYLEPQPSRSASGDRHRAAASQQVTSDPLVVKTLLTSHTSVHGLGKPNALGTLDKLVHNILPAAQLEVFIVHTSYCT